MRKPAETARWLQILGRLLDADIATETWAHYCRELRWIGFEGCDRERGRAVIHKLFDKHPSIKLRAEGSRLVATVSSHLSEKLVRDFLDHLAASRQFNHGQAFGELLTLIAVRGEPHKWATQLLATQLEGLANELKESIATGIAFAGARLWDEPDVRAGAWRILCRLIPYATAAAPDRVPPLLRMGSGGTRCATPPRAHRVHPRGGRPQMRYRLLSTLSARSPIPQAG